MLLKCVHSDNGKAVMLPLAISLQMLLHGVDAVRLSQRWPLH